MRITDFDPDELVTCDGCGKKHNDAEQCECGTVRCPACREPGCRRCDSKPWTTTIWGSD